MSADLVAAFGNDGSSAVGSTEAKIAQSINQVVPRPKPLPAHHSVATPVEQQRPLWERDNKGNDVLFDASDTAESDEDDFGDFEAVEQPESLETNTDRHSSAAFDLLELADQPLTTNQISAPQKSGNNLPQPGDDPFDVFNVLSTYQQPISLASNADDEPADDWGDFQNVTSVTSSNPVHREHSKANDAIQGSKNALSEDEEWDKFEDGPTPQAEKHIDGFPQQPLTMIERTSTVSQTTILQAQSYTRDRPTNVPPPYSLLNLLVLAVQRKATENRSSLSQRDLPALAAGIVSLYRTTSRIIAGRSQRWKRDTILAQSMRISEVNQKHTGMKLTSLDRSETTKENQEAIEVAMAWTKHNHAFNPTLLKAKVQKPAMSINADMKIRVVTGAGVLNEREPCAVCGLKRNERVMGIDMKVDDIFEEFWIEHWGHTDCRSFWFENKDLLGQR